MDFRTVWSPYLSFFFYLFFFFYLERESLICWDNKMDIQLNDSLFSHHFSRHPRMDDQTNKHKQKMGFYFYSYPGGGYMCV